MSPFKWPPFLTLNGLLNLRTPYFQWVGFSNGDVSKTTIGLECVN